MNIRQIKFEYVTAPTPLINPKYSSVFVPYYLCIMTTDKGTYYGEGETEYVAENDAMDKLRHALALEADKALEDYNIRHDAGTLDIA